MSKQTTKHSDVCDNHNAPALPSDTEMLDWLEAQGSNCYGWEVQTERDYPNVKGCVWLKRNISPRESACLKARDAIAKAMSNSDWKKELVDNERV